MAPVSPTLPVDQPKPETHMRSQGSEGSGGRSGRARNLTSWRSGADAEAEEARLVGTNPPSSAAARTAWHPSLSLASQQKQNTTKSKTNTGR